MTNLSTPTVGSINSPFPSSDPPRANRTDEVKDVLSHDPVYERTGAMSYAQARLYFLYEHVEDKSSHTTAYIGKFNGYLDLAKLQGALETVGRKHESLRSSYFFDEGSRQAIQAVNSLCHITIHHELVQSQTAAERKIDALKAFAFDIERGHLMRVVVLSEPRDTHHVVFLHHHIALDGTSWDIFLRDLSQAYAGQETIDGSGRVQQAIDMAAKQAITHQVPNLRKEIEFWRAVHLNAPQHPLPLFPFSKVGLRQPSMTHNTETLMSRLDGNVADIVRKTASALRLTPFHFYLSVLAVFLARCLEIYDFNIGVVDAN